MKNTNVVKKVAVGLSGGVDSSVAAYLLKKQGYEVTGVYMECWDPEAPGCSSKEDKNYAVQVAATLGIKFVSLNFINDYKEKVLAYFYDEYSKGRTPNPDVMCNKEIKFGLFFDWAINNGFDYVATGHYARVSCDNGFCSLLKGIDVTKDQSYFLYQLTSKQLSKILFPVGGMLKKEIREIAKKATLPTAQKPDSTGICFIGDIDVRKFLKEKIQPKEGNVVLKNGEVIGIHEGVWFYTVGQRRGFTVKKYHGSPLYVIGKNIDKNELIVGTDEDAYSSVFTIKGVHWISEIKGPKDLFCEVRIRHLGEMFSCSLISIDGGYEVTLDKPAFGVAAGQSAVLYKDSAVLGGGIIQ